MPGRPFAACALASVLDSGKVPGPGLDGGSPGVGTRPSPQTVPCAPGTELCKTGGDGLPGAPSPRYLTLRVAGWSKRSGSGPGAELENLLFRAPGDAWQSRV